MRERERAREEDRERERERVRESEREERGERRKRQKARKREKREKKGKRKSHKINTTKQKCKVSKTIFKRKTVFSSIFINYTQSGSIC